MTTEAERAEARRLLALGTMSIGQIARRLGHTGTWVRYVRSGYVTRKRRPVEARPVSICARRRERIELGLAVLECHARRGVPMSCATIAAATGISHQGATMMVERALKKVRNQLRFTQEGRVWREVKEIK